MNAIGKLAVVEAGMLVVLTRPALAGETAPVVPLWDAYVVVAGELRSDGSVAGCTTPGARIMPDGKCWVPGLIAKAAGSPVALPLQDFLERALGPEVLAKKPVAVGVLPHWRSSGGRSPRPVLANDEFVIVYRVTK